MTIDGHWYMAECTSTKEPVPYMDGETFYLPVNIEFLEEPQMYSYQEYRFNLPINYDIPEEIPEHLANVLDEFSGTAVVLKEENISMQTAGVAQIKAYCEATSNAPVADVGVFVGGVEEWKPDTEYKLNDLFSYKGNMGYVKQPMLTSLDVYPPDGTGLLAIYVPYVVPGADGVKPWAYGMHVHTGDLVRKDGTVWEAKKDMIPCVWERTEENEWKLRSDLS